MLMLIRTHALYRGDLFNFNTSHVNVNLHGNIGVTTATANFNTSHVNVNLEYPEKGAVDYRISIHLMLMLITSSVRPVPSHIAFQYISC